MASPPAALPPATRRWLLRAGRVAVLALALGLVGGVAFAALDLPLYSEREFRLVLLERLVVEMNRIALLTAAAASAASLLFVALRRRVGWTDRGVARAVLAGLLSLPAFVLVDRVNARFLPGLLEPASIAGNAALGLLLLAVWWLLAPFALSWLGGARRFPIRSLALLLAVFALLHGARTMVRGMGWDPNVILIVVDALRADELGCYGYARATSPHIDRLAEDAVRFSQAVSQSTFTKTSIASLLTGLYPHHHGVYFGHTRDEQGRPAADALDEELTTLAELLQRERFLTGAWLRQPHLRREMGFGQGFTEYHDGRQDRDRSILDWRLEAMRHALFGPRPAPELPGGISQILDAHRSWLAHVGLTQPFFSYLHFLDLHEPYAPEPPYDAMFGRYADLVARDSLEWAAWVREVGAGERLPRPEEVSQIRASYDGLVRMIDDELGRYFEHLRRVGEYDRSLIILTADHGDAFLEHGFLSHSDVPYEELIRVPLIVKFPDSRYAGRVVDRQVRLVDVVPTVLDVVGVSTAPPTDGTSLVRLIEQPEAVGDSFDVAVSEFVYSVAVRTESWKLIRLPSGRYELYDLAADPTELWNWAEASPDGAQGLHLLLRRVASAQEARRQSRVPLDADTAAELRALGYVP